MTETSLQRLTVNLVQKTATALDRACTTTGDTKTDTINRAVRFYDWLLTEEAAGKRIGVIDAEGNFEGIKFL